VCRSSSVSACVISASEANTQSGQKDSKDKLVDELRTQVAVKYGRDTVMTNEDIAAAVGI
jgi:hypothetical protein